MKKIPQQEYTGEFKEQSVKSASGGRRRAGGARAGPGHFGMKMHSGVDVQSGLIHRVVCTAANEADVVHANELLHGQETQVHGDSGIAKNEVRAKAQAALVNLYFVKRKLLDDQINLQAAR